VPGEVVVDPVHAAVTSASAANGTTARAADLMHILLAFTGHGSGADMTRVIVAATDRLRPVR
jgi:hypothetical protein